MSLLSSSVYSSLFTYNAYMLTWSYRHLTFDGFDKVARITCISHDSNFLIVGFRD